MSAPDISRPDPTALKAIISRVGELAALPHVIFRVIEAAGSPNSPAAEIERAVVVDPGFAARLLAEANSAGVGGGVHISSLRQAVMRIGCDGVRNLALAVGTFDLFIGKTDQESLRRREWWRVSLETALHAKWLAHSLRSANPDDAYAAGLLHLVGRTVLDRCGGVPYPHALELATHRQFPIAEAEWHVFGAHAGQVGTASGVHWGFPDRLCRAMNVIDPPVVERELPAVVALAATFAIDGDPMPDPWITETLGVSAEEVPKLCLEARAAVESAARRLAS